MRTSRLFLKLLKRVFGNQPSLNANKYAISIPKVFWWGIKRNWEAPAPIAARGEHLDQTVVHQNMRPLTGMKEVVWELQERRLMSKHKEKKARKSSQECRCRLIRWSVWGVSLVLITGCRVWSEIRPTWGLRTLGGYSTPHMKQAQQQNVGVQCCLIHPLWWDESGQLWWFEETTVDKLRRSLMYQPCPRSRAFIFEWSSSKFHEPFCECRFLDVSQEGFGFVQPIKGNLLVTGCLSGICSSDSNSSVSNYHL